LFDELAKHLPQFPRNIGSKDSDRLDFIEQLIYTQSKHGIDIEPARSGFFDKQTFATFSEIIKADGTVRLRLLPTPSPNGEPLEDIRGSLKGAKQTVLKLARQSTYLAFAIGVGLATPLPAYFKIRRQEGRGTKLLLSETAVFNLSGPSTSGKTTAGLAAMTLAGSPDRAETLDSSNWYQAAARFRPLALHGPTPKRRAPHDLG
jgi:hypothetical protein